MLKKKQKTKNQKNPEMGTAALRTPSKFGVALKFGSRLSCLLFLRCPFIHFVLWRVDWLSWLFWGTDVKIMKQQFLPHTSSLPSPGLLRTHCAFRSTMVQVWIHLVDFNLRLHKQVMNLLGALGFWCLASISKYLRDPYCRRGGSFLPRARCQCSLFTFKGTAVPAAFSWGSKGSSCSKCKIWSRCSL